MRRGWALLLGVLLCLPVTGWGKATIDARADRLAVDIGGVVRLQVIVDTDLRDGREPGQITTPNLDDWQVVSQFQQTSVVNTASKQIVTLGLRPQKTGRLTIGPFVLTADGKQQKTKPIVISVTGQAPPPPPPAQAPPPPPAQTPPPPPAGTALSTAPDRRAFLLWEVDKRRAWLGEQLEIGLYLYVHRNLGVVHHDFGSINLEGFWTHALPQQGRDSQVTIIGTDAFVRSPVIQYRAFPLRAGQLRLPAIHAELTLADRSLFGGRQSRQPRDAAPLTIDVDALPMTGQPPGFAGPAVGRVGLTAQVDRTRVPAADGVQLTILTTSEGLIGNVPEPRFDLPGWRAWPPTHETRTEMRGRRLYGLRTTRVLLRPTEGGMQTIPAISLSFFDPVSGTYQVASTNPIQVEVVGPLSESTAGAGPGPGRPAASSAPASPAAPASDSGPALRAIRTRSELRPEAGEGWAHPLFPVLVLLPPVLWLGVLGGQRWRAWNASGAEGRAVKRAAADTRRAMEKLPEAPSARLAFAELSRLLVAFLELRLRRPLRGLTHDAQRRTLAEAGLAPPVVDALLTELENCEFARFSPEDVRASELQEAVRRALTLVGQVDEAAA